MLQAMCRVPRHESVPPEYLGQSYENHPLPIGHGKIISQPFIVAYMSENLAIKPGDRVLDILTVSGYQAAVLAAMEMEAYSIEIIPELAAEAEARLKRLVRGAGARRRRLRRLAGSRAVRRDHRHCRAHHVPLPLAPTTAAGRAAGRFMGRWARFRPCGSLRQKQAIN